MGPPPGPPQQRGIQSGRRTTPVDLAAVVQLREYTHHILGFLLSHPISLGSTRDRENRSPADDLYIRTYIGSPLLPARFLPFEVHFTTRNARSLSLSFLRSRLGYNREDIAWRSCSYSMVIEEEVTFIEARADQVIQVYTRSRVSFFVVRGGGGEGMSHTCGAVSVGARARVYTCFSIAVFIWFLYFTFLLRWEPRRLVSDMSGHARRKVFFFFFWCSNGMDVRAYNRRNINRMI